MEAIQQCLLYLRDPQEVHLNDTLLNLSQLLSETSRDEALRTELASYSSVWEMFYDSISYCLERDVTESRLRVLRGLVLLSRNLIISCRERSRVFKYYVLVLQSIGFDVSQSHMIQNLNIAFFQFLVNATSSVEPVKVEENSNAKQVRYEYDNAYLKEFMSKVELANVDQESGKVALLTYLNNLFNSSEFLYNYLNTKGAVPKLLDILLYFNLIREENEVLNQEELLIISLFQKIYLHESFYKFWVNVPKKEEQLLLLDNAQMILTNKDNFDQFEITSLLSWVCQVYDTTAPQFIENLQNSIVDDQVHLQMFKLLDLITNLGNFNHARDFLNHYKILDQMCSLLQILESKFERLTLKENNGKRKLPGLKAPVIEIITSLTYQNPDNQNLVRQNHTLEIVLNNCQLDKNEPFIKERAIICLKYLLENNSANQDFVKALTPEKVQISDEGKLEQMGLELDISKDGKVQVHNKNTNKIKELK